MNRLAEAWAELVGAMNKDGSLTADDLETLRFAFVAGAVTYRRLMFDTVDNSIDPDDVTDVDDLNALSEELDAMAEDIHQVAERERQQH